MFNRDLLTIINLKTPSLKEYKGLNYTKYPQNAFFTPSSEESISIARAPKLDKESGLRFWISAVLHEDWSDRKEFFESYVNDARYVEIDETTFNQRLTELCSQLITMPPIPLSPGKFIGGIEMYHLTDSDCISDLFAEYDNEFIRFAWNSTA